jgi:cell division transport system permease protein
MNWLRMHGNACWLVWTRLLATPLNTFLSILGIGIALALPAGGLLLLNQSAGFIAGATATPQFTIFLKIDIERKATQGVAARLRDRGDVVQVQVLLREDTLARMKANEALGDVIAALPKNPFPDAIMVTPAGEAPEAIEKLAAEARQWREVEQVQVDAHWARRLAALLKLARTGIWLLAVMLGAGLVAITFNTVRLQALARQAEAEVSGLLGATDAFIRRPFLWHGSMLGVLGGMAAWLIVAAALHWLHGPMTELSMLYGGALMLTPPTLPEGLLMLAAATLLGWLGAVLSVCRYSHDL